MKVGGKLTYSTCSLNPVENEAVVAAALLEFKGVIRLVQTSLPGFRHQEGISSWPLLNNETKDKEGDSWFVEYKTYADVPESSQKHAQIKPTMFSNHYPAEILAELHKCVRVMPHHQNTSGFFITVIEKIAECADDAPVTLVEDRAEPSDLVI